MSLARGAVSSGGCVQRVREFDAPAKLNLGLRILGRRPDGYHRIESLFVPLDLCDRVRVGATPLEAGAESTVGFALREGPGDVPAGAANLAARAARAFLSASGVPAAVQVELWKRIPAAAGLGGGSSDAGAVLRALAELFPGALDRSRLAELALEIGADVPFFLDPTPAWVGGIGEEIRPLGSIPKLAWLLANPGDSLGTSEVYALYDTLPGALTPASPGSTMRALSHLPALRDAASAVGDRSQQIYKPGGSSGSEDLGRGDPSASTEWLVALVESDLLRNDLGPAAERLEPRVVGLRRSLEELGAVGSGMSGSGATVFGVFADRQSAQAALDRATFAASTWATVAESAASRTEPGEASRVRGLE